MKRKIRRVLIVEDDLLQAGELGRFIRETGDTVLGPVSTVEKALPLVPQAEAAVPGIALSGRQVFQLADRLIARNVPVVFYADRSHGKDLPRRFASVPLVRKPVTTLADAATVALALHGDDDIGRILPKLRLAARLIYREASVADRLVERLLQDAVAHVERGHDLNEDDTQENWLVARMCAILDDYGERLMN